MRASYIRSFAPIRYGAYICLSVPAASQAAAADVDVPALAERLGLRTSPGIPSGHSSAKAPPGTAGAPPPGPGSSADLHLPQDAARTAAEKTVAGNPPLAVQSSE